jgi:hypothetical protein
LHIIYVNTCSTCKNIAHVGSLCQLHLICQFPYTRPFAALNPSGDQIPNKIRAGSPVCYLPFSTGNQCLAMLTGGPRRTLRMLSHGSQQKQVGLATPNLCSIIRSWTKLPPCKQSVRNNGNGDNERLGSWKLDPQRSLRTLPHCKRVQNVGGESSTRDLTIFQFPLLNILRWRTCVHEIMHSILILQEMRRYS